MSQVYYYPSPGAPWETLRTAELDVLRGDDNDPGIVAELLEIGLLETLEDSYAITELGIEARDAWARYSKKTER